MWSPKRLKENRQIQSILTPPLEKGILPLSPQLNRKPKWLACGFLQVFLLIESMGNDSFHSYNF